MMKCVLFLCFVTLGLIHPIYSEHVSLPDNINSSQSKYQDRLKTDSNAQYYEKMAQNCSHFFIIAGGSTAANTGKKFNYHVNNSVIIWNQSLPGWQPATFPLAGGDGQGSSPFLLFADAISNKTNATVCLVNVARIGSHITNWHPSAGKFNSLLTNAYQLMDKYTSVGYVLWAQGEADANSNNYFTEYGNYLYDIVRQSSENVKWIIAETSYSPWNQDQFEDYVRKDQSNVVEYSAQSHKIYAGPNTDSVCQNYRYDDFYFDKEGINVVANGWIKAFQNKNSSFTLGNGHCDDRFVTSLDAFLSFIFLCSIIIVVMTIIIGCCYCFKINNYHNKVYYMVIKDDGQTDKLNNGTYYNYPKI